PSSSASGVEMKPVAARIKPTKKMFLLLRVRKFSIFLFAALLDCLLTPSRLDRTGVRASGGHTQFGEKPLGQDEIRNHENDYPCPLGHHSPLRRTILDRAAARADVTAVT